MRSPQGFCCVSIIFSSTRQEITISVGKQENHWKYQTRVKTPCGSLSHPSDRRFVFFNNLLVYRDFFHAQGKFLYKASIFSTYRSMILPKSNPKI
jgi:hypothetical protein